MILLTGQVLSAMVISTFRLARLAGQLDHGIMTRSGAVLMIVGALPDDEISLSFRVPRSSFPVLVPGSQNGERGTGNGERSSCTSLTFL